MKANASSFDKEKKSIGEKFYSIATDPTDVLKTYFMYVVSCDIPDFKNGAISNQKMIKFAIRKEILDENIHQEIDTRVENYIQMRDANRSLDKMLHTQHHSSSKGNFLFFNTAQSYIGKLHKRHVESGIQSFFGKNIKHESLVEEGVLQWKYANGYYVGSMDSSGFIEFADLQTFNVRQVSKNKFRVFAESRFSNYSVGYTVNKETATVVRKISSSPVPKVSYNIIEHKNLGSRSVER